MNRRRVVRGLLATVCGAALIALAACGDGTQTKSASQSTANGRVQMLSVIWSRPWMGMMRGWPSVPFRTSAFLNVRSGLPYRT